MVNSSFLLDQAPPRDRFLRKPPSRSNVSHFPFFAGRQPCSKALDSPTGLRRRLYAREGLRVRETPSEETLASSEGGLRVNPFDEAQVGEMSMDAFVSYLGSRCVAGLFRWPVRLFFFPPLPPPLAGNKGPCGLPPPDAFASSQAWTSRAVLSRFFFSVSFLCTAYNRFLAPLCLLTKNLDNFKAS